MPITTSALISVEISDFAVIDRLISNFIVQPRSLL